MSHAETRRGIGATERASHIEDLPGVAMLAPPTLGILMMNRNVGGALRRADAVECPVEFSSLYAAPTNNHQLNNGSP
jgi:hypothetical protein